MKNIIKTILLTTCCVGAFTAANATNLVEVYNDSLHNDPTFKAAEATMLSTKENSPQAFSVILPQISATGIYTPFAYNRDNTRSATVNNSAGATNYHSRVTDYGVTLTQDIFNWTDFKNISVANANSKAAEATYAAAAQDLMQRVSQSYFAILEAEDILRFAVKQQQALKQQLDQANARFKVGLNTKTDYYQAKASYESAVATAIKDRNDVDVAKENLRAITGKTYNNFATVKSTFPLLKPVPSNMEQWVDVANRNNRTLISDGFTVIGAQQNIKALFGGHLPSLNLNANYDRTVTHFESNDTSNIKHSYGVGVQLNVPIFSGGDVSSQVQQAIYDYDNASDTQELDRRTVADNVRTNYLGVISGVSQIGADKESIAAFEIAVKGAIEEYKVGTKTMLDVLIQQKDLFNAQSTYATDLYSYINAQIQLKQEAGTLNYSDLKSINSWLGSNSNSAMNIVVPQDKMMQTPQKPTRTARPTPASRQRPNTRRSNQARPTNQTQQRVTQQ